MRRYPSGEVLARSLLIAAVFVTAACGAQSSGSAGGSGLYGSVRISPASPVCGANSACTRPARGFRLVFSRNGKTVASAKTDREGRYRVQLGRGRYVVRAGRVAVSPKSGLVPRQVTVPSGRFAKRDFVYDSGIR
jgi:hypothetical protein